MNEMVKARSTELNNIIVSLSQAKTVEEITTLINKAVDKNDELQDLLEDEVISSKDKEVLIEGLKEELAQIKIEHQEEITSVTNKYEEQLSSLQLIVDEKDSVIENMESAQNYADSDEVGELNLHEILDRLHRIEHLAIEMNGKVEGTEAAVRNINLNSNSAQKTLNKVSANISNLVDLLKVYVKNVCKIEDRVEQGHTLAKNALNKAEEVEVQTKDTCKEVEDLREDLGKLEDTVNDVEVKNNVCMEEVKEVKGLFKKLKGLFK